MARLIYALNQTLDGFVDHDAMAPDPVLFRHFIDDISGLAGCVYGRRMYEIMRYWDDDRPEWGEPERAYAAGWRWQHKWVVSTTLEAVGPNATLVAGDAPDFVRELKARLDGEIEVAGTRLAASMTEAGLIDEYRIYLHPVASGSGTPYFAAAPPRLHLVASERIGTDVIRLTYVPEDID